MTAPSWMISKVCKYPLEGDDVVDIEMPEGADVLHVDEQGGALCLWARVDPSKPMRPRRFRIVGTGHDIRDDSGASLAFVGTVMPTVGNVVHVFEMYVGDFVPAEGGSWHLGVLITRPRGTIRGRRS